MNLACEQFPNDLCLLKKESDKGTVIICMCVDDLAIVGKKEAVEETKMSLKEYFTTKKLGEVSEYIG